MKLATACWLALAALAHAAGRLEFDSLLKEVTPKADAREITTDFSFTNKGDKPVTIVKSDPGCSCLHVQIKEGKMTYAPGESGLIRATFDMGNFSGTVDKVIAIWLNGDPEEKPSLRLTSRVHIPVLVALEPKTLSWEIGGDAGKKAIRIDMSEGQTIHVKSVSSSNKSFDLNLVTVKDGREYRLEVTPQDTDGPKMAVIRIETDSVYPKHRIQQAFAVVRKSPNAQAAAGR